MAMRRSLVVLVAVVAALATGCGVPASHSATPSPSATAPTGHATGADGWSTAVMPLVDGELQVNVTVTGPLTVEGGCVPSLTAWADDADGSPVPTPSPSGSQAHCLAIALIQIPAGSSRQFSADIPTPPDPGTYTIHGLLQTSGGQPIPVVTITV
jgi:hypothetical protein